MKCIVFNIIAFLIVGYLFGQETEFLNQTITPYSKTNPIPKDTLFLNDEYIDLSKYLKIDSFNYESLRDWWGGFNNENKPPIELFLKHFSIDSVKEELRANSKFKNIEQSGLKPYFYLVNETYISEHRRKSYIFLSKPCFNKQKDWAFIIKLDYTPYGDASSGGSMFVYVKVNSRWLLYHDFNLWLS